MSSHRSVLRGAFAALVAALALNAQAVVTTQTVDASAPAGQLAFPSLRFDFAGPYALISFNLEFSFDAARLTFDEAASKAVLDGVAQPLQSFFSMLSAQGSLSTNYGTDSVTGLAFGAYSYVVDPPFAINHQLVFTPAFRIAPSALPGQQATVTFIGELADVNAADGDGFSTSAAVSAVPEPGTVATLLAGLIVLGAWSRRRGAS